MGKQAAAKRESQPRPHGLAEKKGFSVLSGWCLSNTPIPYFPFLEALGTISEEYSGSSSQMRAWLTKTSPNEALEKASTLTPQVWKDHAFSVIIKELLIISTKQPIIIFIDDLHWADSASVALIHYISRAIASEKIMLMATYRSEEMTGRRKKCNCIPWLKPSSLWVERAIMLKFPFRV